MATYLSNDLTNVTGGLQTTVPVGFKTSATVQGARLKRLRGSFTYASQASTDTLVVGDMPPGATFAYGVLTADTSSGSTTMEVGITGDLARFKAAAAFTSTDTPTFFGKCAPVVTTPSTATQTVLVTLGAATAPASGNLCVDIFYSMPN